MTRSRTAPDFRRRAAKLFDQKMWCFGPLHESASVHSGKIVNRRRPSLLILALFLGGCSAPHYATVEGTVTLDGKPLADLEVQFIPEPTTATGRPPISAYTDEDGRYRIEATGTSGVSVGKHRVCINDATLMMPGGGKMDVDPDSGAPGAPGVNQQTKRSRVPNTYSDATRTPFQAVDIRPGTQTQNFALKSKP